MENIPLNINVTITKNSIVMSVKPIIKLELTLPITEDILFSGNDIPCNDEYIYDICSIAEFFRESIYLKFEYYSDITYLKMQCSGGSINLDEYKFSCFANGVLYTLDVNYREKTIVGHKKNLFEE